jgi:hypothetical protein
MLEVIFNMYNLGCTSTENRGKMGIRAEKVLQAKESVLLIPGFFALSEKICHHAAFGS